ncbi:hypothetical protein DICA1_E13344 [Diutina catenulata]
MKFNKLLLLAAVAIAAPVAVADDAANEIANADAANAVNAAVPAPPVDASNGIKFDGDEDAAPDANTKTPSAKEIEEAAAAAGTKLTKEQAKEIAKAYKKSSRDGDIMVAAAQGEALPDASNGIHYGPRHRTYYYYRHGRRYRYHGYHRGYGWKWGWGWGHVRTCGLLFCYNNRYYRWGHWW